MGRAWAADSVGLGQAEQDVASGLWRVACGWGSGLAGLAASVLLAPALALLLAAAAWPALALQVAPWAPGRVEALGAREEARGGDGDLVHGSATEKQRESDG